MWPRPKMPSMAEPLWTSDEIIAATRGKLAGKPFAATGVSIDTRTIEPGDLFVALGGVRDGHEFVEDAMAKGGVAVLNADDRWFDLLKDEAQKVGAVVRTFGHGDRCDARLIDFQGADGHAVVQARFHGKGLDFPILQTGFHWGLNSMAVLLMLEALDVDLGDSLAALGSFEPLEGRGAEKTVH